MEAIKGSDVNVPDAVFAWMLDGRGGVKPLENTDVIDEAHPCWLHLNYVHHDSAQWLATTPLLPNNVRDALAGESTRFSSSLRSPRARESSTWPLATAA